jgi:hypothetical protein
MHFVSSFESSVIAADLAQFGEVLPAPSDCKSQNDQVLASFAQLTQGCSCRGSE